MTRNQLIVFELIANYLFGKELEVGYINKLSQNDWNDIYKISKEQGVAAICFDAVNKSLDLTDIPKDILIKWTLLTESIEIRYKKQEEVLNIIKDIAKESNLPIILFKGFSLSKYYPKPNHRECGDIDIYAGENYSKLNDIFRVRGAMVKEDYYRHSHVVINGVTIENHAFLCDSTRRKHNKRVEDKLNSIVSEILLNNNSEKIKYPNSDFNALFLSWHSAAHFMFDKIQLRHLCDWGFYLESQSLKLDGKSFLDVKRGSNFDILSDILTYICLNHFGVKREKISPILSSESLKVDKDIANKVLDYILKEPEESIIDNKIWINRIKLANKVIVKDSWKFKEVYKISLFSLLFESFIGIFKK